MALVKYMTSVREGLSLIESFVGEHHDEPWNDFCAVIGINGKTPPKLIFEDTNCTNVYKEDVFIANTLEETSQDHRIIRIQQNLIESLKAELELKDAAFQYIRNSVSWKLTYPLRLIKRIYSFRL
jgi:hypothetical protein